MTLMSLDALAAGLPASCRLIGLDPGSAPRELVTLLSRVPGLLDTLEQGGQGELLAASVWGSDSGPWRILSLPTPLIYHWALEASRRPVPLEEFLDG